MGICGTNPKKKSSTRKASLLTVRDLSNPTADGRKGNTISLLSVTLVPAIQLLVDPNKAAHHSFTQKIIKEIWRREHISKLERERARREHDSKK
jgi:hypothetical protein